MLRRWILIILNNHGFEKFRFIFCVPPSQEKTGARLLLIKHGVSQAIMKAY
jgi:hypothetical protein